MLKDPSSDKRLFERNSVDDFRIPLNDIGELKKIRIEHDGRGFASGWFLDKVSSMTLTWQKARTKHS